MALKLYYHPLSSFCWKVLIALYENDTPFEPMLVNLQDPAEREAFLKLWPIGKFPVLRDEERGGWMVPESSIIVEYLGRHHPGPVKLVPDDPDMSRRIRMADRFIDLYVHQPMQKVIDDRLRPDGQKDPLGVERARAQMTTALGMLEGNEMDAWLIGTDFTLADCSAMPALFYANKVMPLAGRFDKAGAYLERLKARPSVARVLKEAEPYFAMFPQ
jgi:glutathione S-transferase